MCSPSSETLRVGEEQWTRLLLVAVCFAFFGVEAGPHEDRLITRIFHDNDNPYYQPSRPVPDESSALEVKFGLTLQQIIDVDEKNQIIRTNVWLNYEWKDYKLEWSESEFGGVKSIRLPPTDIWTPDILMYNSASEDVDSKFPTNVVVYSSGTCSWIPVGIYVSTCAIDVRRFPFDEQTCTMKFGSWTYDGNKINLTSKHDSVDLSTYVVNGEWYLLEAPAVLNVNYYECCPEPYIHISFKIRIQRRSWYYLFNLIIPCAILSLLALVTFALPPDAGEKIALGITVLLSLTVFQLIVADKVPVSSLDTPLISVYVCSMMLMCALSVIMNVIVLNLHHRSPAMYDMPAWVRVVICKWLARLLRIKRPAGRTVCQLEVPVPLYDKDPSTVRTPDNSLGGEGSDATTVPTGLAVQHHGQRSELLAILNELRSITNKFKVDSEKSDATGDWKLVAMVIDRLCFCVFTVYYVVGIIFLLMNAF